MKKTAGEGFLFNITKLQGTFNTGKAVHRGAAFIAWRRLVLNLACQGNPFTSGKPPYLSLIRMEGHLFNPKRVNLVLLPVWNGLKHEKSMAVRSECIQTFAFLILNLSFHSSLKSLLEPVFRTAIHDKDVDGKMDFQLVLWQILGKHSFTWSAREILILNLVILATPKPRVSVSLRNLCEQSDQPPEVLLRWMNSAPEEDLPFISGMLLEVLEKEQQSTQMVSVTMIIV